VWPVLAHELGHNMSLKHADALLCPTAADSAYSTVTKAWTGTGCREDGYGDGQDVMSASRQDFAPFLSAPQSLRTGIIPPAAATIIETAGTQNVTLLPLAGRTGIRAAEVVSPTTGVAYYVEYRTQVGRDLRNVYGVKTGVRVLRLNPTSGETVLLDPSPSGQTRDPDPTLPVGQTFSSYDGAVSINTVSANSANAVVAVTIGTAAVTPASGGSGFTAMSPVRVMDTRIGLGVAKARVGPGGQVTLSLVLPAGTTAVVLNVTATGPTASSYLSVYPAGQGRPTASNLNFVKGQTIPNLVIAQVGAGNKVTFYNAAGTVDVLADVAGYYAP
jgi:hypothetical protein